MKKPNQEIEVKIYFADLDSLREKLDTLGATIVQERVYEQNIRYDDENKSFADKGYVLRLRQDNHVRLTFKEPSTIEHGIIRREELEVEVSDFETMENILEKLGFTRYMIYEKYRTTYQLDDAEIMLDELPYGNFVEVEGSEEVIEATLDKIGLSGAERREQSYTKLFDFVKHHLELDFRDLTFENFEDITVSEEDFIPPGSIVIS